MKLIAAIIFLLSSAPLVTAAQQKNSSSSTLEKKEVKNKQGPSKGKKVLFLGDSLTAGYGVAKTDSFVGLLSSYWKKKNPDHKMINAGVSGSTSASCSKRLKWQLRTEIDVVFIALGANDGLRGVPVKTTKKNLDDCIKMAKENNLEVIFAGMLMPRNYGEEYRQNFEAIFSDLNKKHKPIFIEFLLDGVGGVAELNLADGIHPNEKGHKVLFKKINTVMEKVL